MSSEPRRSRELLRLLFSQLQEEWTLSESQRDELDVLRARSQKLEAEVLRLRIRLVKSDAEIASLRTAQERRRAPATPELPAAPKREQPQSAKQPQSPRQPSSARPVPPAQPSNSKAQLENNEIPAAYVPAEPNTMERVEPVPEPGSGNSSSSGRGPGCDGVEPHLEPDGQWSLQVSTQERCQLELVRINRQGFKEFRSAVDRALCIWIPGGTTVLGDESSHAMESEKPTHAVYLRPYFLDKCPVSNEAYARFLKVAESHEFCHPAEPPGKSHVPGHWGSAEYTRVSAEPHCPVVFVDWFDAYAYLAWVGRRLPTEAEWEYAARGRRRFQFPWGNTSPSSKRANYAREVGHTSPVGSLPKGSAACGAMDMAGNVWEWVYDWMGPYRKAKEPRECPRGPETGEHKLIRGGSWSSPEDSCRGAFRNWCDPLSRGPHLGFRGGCDDF